MAERVEIHTEYITLGQMLKKMKIIESGGEEKIFVKTHDISVNEVKEDRRGRKLRPGDKVRIDGKDYEVCTSAI